ncbi:MAG: ABC transporter permease [Candidatus Dormibacter sp.]|uniref:ABC transporter permease n=1 Tax=Candidatus Dormibacter sp. TaxID=2973982 RepID=UPI000DB7F7C2|nr:MAG: ribose ABC transporter permease [Candidatus Dormibacteraeota bacterium]
MADSRRPAEAQAVLHRPPQGGLGRAGAALTRGWGAVRIQDFGALLALVLLCLLFAWLAPGFRTFSNVVTVSRQVATEAIVAAGMTFVIITAGIDLSVGSLVAVGGVVVAGLMTRQHLPLPLAILLTLVVLGLFGAFNGLSVARLGLQPFIVTLAMFASARGIAEVYTGGTVITVADPSFSVIGNGYLGPVPVPVIIALAVLLVAYVVLSRTRFGRYVYAIGGNEQAARISGIPIARVKTTVYILTGLAAGIGGIITASRLFSGDPQAGLSLELDVIAAVVIGGTSLFGGIGNIRGTLIGVLIIGVISNGLTILNVQTFWQDVTKGAVIFIAMLLDMLLRKLESRRIRAAAQA